MMQRENESDSDPAPSLYGENRVRNLRRHSTCLDINIVHYSRTLNHGDRFEQVSKLFNNAMVLTQPTTTTTTTAAAIAAATAATAATTVAAATISMAESSEIQKEDFIETQIFTSKRAAKRSNHTDLSNDLEAFDEHGVYIPYEKRAKFEQQPMDE